MKSRGLCKRWRKCGNGTHCYVGLYYTCRCALIRVINVLFPLQGKEVGRFGTFELTEGLQMGTR